MPQYLTECLKSYDFSVKKTANSIVKLFGERLAVILLTLKKGEKVNRISRKDWNDTHWEYWNSLKNVIKLDKVLSKHIGWNFQDIKKEKSEAEALNSYILSVIIVTMRGVKGGASSIENNIVISIANYVRNGLFADRG